MLETRSLVEPVELERIDTGARRLEALAVPFGVRTSVLGQFDETIERLTPTKDLRLLVEHDPHKLLARRSTGSLAVTEHQEGLHVEAELPETTYANDLAALMDRGDIRSMSFGFEVTDDSWSYAGKPHRTIRSGHLHEVSVVATPIYDTTEAVLRSATNQTLWAVHDMLWLRLRLRHRQEGMTR